MSSLSCQFKLMRFQLFSEHMSLFFFFFPTRYRNNSNSLLPLASHPSFSTEKSCSISPPAHLFQKVRCNNRQISQQKLSLSEQMKYFQKHQMVNPQKQQATFRYSMSAAFTSISMLIFRGCSTRTMQQCLWKEANTVKQRFCSFLLCRYKGALCLHYGKNKEE